MVEKNSRTGGAMSHLARFVWAGGLVGPLASGLIAATVMGRDLNALREGIVTWFLTDSMAMVLVVPAALLLADRLRGRGAIGGRERHEQLAPALPALGAHVLALQRIGRQHGHHPQHGWAAVVDRAFSFAGLMAERWAEPLCPSGQGGASAETASLIRSSWPAGAY